MAASMYIGTSGWHYAHWHGPFYPDDLPRSQSLSFYAEHFHSVEVNNSFYKLPEVSTLEAWRDTVSDDFVFAVKASRYITHLKKLKDPQEPLANLYERAEVLGEKLGPLLFQLPPNWRFNPERLEIFLNELSRHYRHVFEFRDQSWFDRRTLDLLRQYGVAFCIYELAGIESPREITADFVYVRLHGPGDAYQGSYDTQALKGWASALHRWAAQGLDTYIFFDNDEAGYAAHNALELQAMLSA